MKSQKVLQNELRELTKLTRQGRQNWEVIVSTTEYNDSQEKPTVNEDGVTLTYLYQLRDCITQVFSGDNYAFDMFKSGEGVMAYKKNK